MLKKGPAKKLTIYIDESEKFGRVPAYEALMELFFREKISGATLFRGSEGYGSKGVLHTSKILDISSDMPVKIEVIESEEAVNRVLAEACRIAVKGLVELSDTVVVKCSGG